MRDQTEKNGVAGTGRRKCGCTVAGPPGRGKHPLTPRRRAKTVMLSLLVAWLTACSAQDVPDSATTGGSSAAQPSPRAAEKTPPADSPPRSISNPRAEVPANQEQSPRPIEQDERYRQLVVGTWEDEYQGKRTMTLNEDGTGTMVVELSGWKATLFASRLEFNMRWRVEEGSLRKETIDGEPQQVVNAILKMMGESVTEPILELTEDRLLLVDKDGETEYDWRRAERAAKASKTN